MSEGTKNILKLIGIVIACFVAYRLVMIVTGMLLKLLIPVAILGGVVYLIYRASGGKSLMGGRRTLP